MKIKMYYEDKFHPTVLEVPDEECSMMVETDYQQRLEEAEDKSQVIRRSVQEIIDEDFSKPISGQESCRNKSYQRLQQYAVHP